MEREKKKRKYQRKEKKEKAEGNKNKRKILMLQSIDKLVFLGQSYWLNIWEHTKMFHKHSESAYNVKPLSFLQDPSKKTEFYT